MRLRSLHYHYLSVCLLPCCIAVAEEPLTVVNEHIKQWTVLLDENGPHGFVEVRRNLTECGDVRLHPDLKELSAEPGRGVVAALKKYPFGKGNNLYSKEKFGDCELRLEFLIGRGSNSGVKLQGRYEIQLYDSHGQEPPTAKDCGGIYPHWEFRERGKGLKYLDEGVPPLVNAAKPAGQWQQLTIIFQAPRFDETGKKTENARFMSVVLNDQTIHKNVEVDSPTGKASTPKPEVAEAPLLLQLDHGAVAFRKVRVRPVEL